VEKDYFDAQFSSIKERLDKIDRSIDELYKRDEEVKERTIKIEARLESGNRTHEYMRKDIEAINVRCSAAKHDELKHKVSMMWKIFGTIGTGLLIAVTGIILKLIKGV